MILMMTVVALLLVACAPPTNLRDETLLNDTSLVTGNPCEAPCFYGITPGETTWQEALTIIEDTSSFSNLQVQASENDASIQAAWQAGSESPVCCQMATEDGQTVSLILLRTAPVMTLGEVIRAHGEPQYLVGSPFTEDQAIMNLVFAETPMIVYAFVAGTEAGEMTADSEIIGALYLTADEMELLLESTELYAWDGYKAYAAYDTGAFDVTPIITLTPAEG